MNVAVAQSERKNSSPVFFANTLFLVFPVLVEQLQPVSFILSNQDHLKPLLQISMRSVASSNLTLNYEAQHSHSPYG